MIKIKRNEGASSSSSTSCSPISRPDLVMKMRTEEEARELIKVLENLEGIKIIDIESYSVPTTETPEGFVGYLRLNSDGNLYLDQWECNKLDDEGNVVFAIPEKTLGLLILKNGKFEVRSTQ